MAIQAKSQVTFKWLAFAVATWTLLAVSHAADIYLEAARSLGQVHTSYRSNASTGVAVRLQAGESIQLIFCLRQTTIIQVQEVLYSNDGNKETVAVTVDNHQLGNFTSHTQTDRGYLWNVFIAASLPPHSLTLLEGWHSIRVDVLKSSDGIELDTVHIWLDDEGLSRAVVDCSLLCASVSSLLQSNATQLWPQATAKQASYPTRCAEEDNVKVPFYLPGITEYTITASHPTYLTFHNRREPNSTYCPFLSNALWTFSNLPKISSENFSRSTPGANLSVQHRQVNGINQVFRIDFPLQGRADGLVDADMGAVLTIVVQQLTEQFDIRVAYHGRQDAPTEVPNRLMKPGETQHKVHIPDYSWSDNVSNLIEIQFQSSVPIHVTDIILERRSTHGDRVTQVYRTSGLVVEALEVDFWWRTPEHMQLTNGETGETWQLVDYFRISLHVPWSGGFAQVFVMYQDGNIRLLPLPPPGVDWIPFGSSVLVGYSNPADLRPSAPVASVTYFPSTLVMHLQYYDGGSATLQLSCTHTHTELSVREIHTGNSDPWTLPFATLRSMYVELGNSDSDSLVVDGKSYSSIMDRWQSLTGNSFSLMRRCESTHATLSPDITIKVKDASSEEKDDV